MSTVFEISQPRWTRPYAFASSISSPRSTRTTPEKPVPSAIESTACPSRCIQETVSNAGARSATSRTATPAGRFDPGSLHSSASDCHFRASASRSRSWSRSTRRFAENSGSPLGRRRRGRTKSSRRGRERAARSHPSLRSVDDDFQRLFLAATRRPAASRCPRRSRGRFARGRGSRWSDGRSRRRDR